MKTARKIDRALLATAIIGSLVVLNVVGMAYFGRLDLTRDKQFTLSSATHQTLAGLTAPLTIRAYFSQDLPPPHATQARYVRDLLEEYFAAGRGKVRFEFIDPVAEESSADKEKKKDIKQDMFGRQIREATAMEQQLQALGVPPVQVRVNQDDKLEVKRAYMGIVVNYQDKHETLPVVSETAGLEYDLTTLIRKVSSAKNTKVAFVSGHAGPDLHEDLGRAHDALSELFEVSEVDLKQPVPSDVEALLLVGPKTPLSDDEKKNFDAYLTSGHAAGVFAGPIKPNLNTLEQEENDPQLQPLLAAYGVNLQSGLVLDAECATVNVTQQQGFMRFNQPVRYPYMPLPKSLSDHPLTRGLAQVAFPFMAPLQLKDELPKDVHGELLVRSSPTSWTQPPPFDLNPTQRWTPPAEGNMQALGMVALLSGPLPRFFNDKPVTGADKSPAPQPARLLVAGGAAFIQDPFFGKPNETLLLNLVDWLVRDDALLAVRSRGLAAAPLTELSDAGRSAVKYGNIVGLPGAFVALGLVRWRRREARRKVASFS